MEFDRKLEYQFGFFIVPAPDAALPSAIDAKTTIMGLASNFNLRSDQGSDLKIKFKDPDSGEAWVQVGGQLLQMTVVSWKHSFWKLTWAGARLDIVADALLRKEIANSDLRMQDVAVRVGTSLQKSAEQLRKIGLVIHRPLVVVTAEATLDAHSPTAVAEVANRFLAPDLRQAVNERQICDAGVRLDWRTELEMGEPTPTTIHRIESIGAQLAFNDVTPRLTMNAQWDVNTSPARGNSPIPLDRLPKFYEVACSWIESRLEIARKQSPNV